MVDRERKRVAIESVRPEIDCGRFPIKRAVGEKVVVRADIFAEGHDSLGARLIYWRDEWPDRSEISMRATLNDEWSAEFLVDAVGTWRYTVEAWVDPFRSWRGGLRKKFEAGQDVSVELLTGAELTESASLRAAGEDAERLHLLAESIRLGADSGRATGIALGQELEILMDLYPDREFSTLYEKELEVWVDRRKALFSSWYELFPRSWSEQPGGQGRLRDCLRLLPEIARMGFDVLYLPPVHPIGVSHRKGRNNLEEALPGDVGSPWAIGSAEGGHRSVDPLLGSIEDLEELVRSASEAGMEVALDLAWQCSPDHPWVQEHPQWFKWRPDGAIQYAENPPKKYQDIFPLNFETDDWRALWQELRDIVLFWIGKEIRIFRIDNPHTKPFPFWEWLISEIHRDYPDVLFLAEAFTRPKVMYRLAKVGFTQSYTYFTWRNSKLEFTKYMNELAGTDVREYFRPNFWPNTPDILPEYLQYGGRPAFIVRLILAATLSSNYGIYGPVFELLINEALPGREEYLDSEKYQIRDWNWNEPGNLKDFIARLNRIRRENPALQTTWNVRFHEVDNESILFFSKEGEGSSDSLLIAVSLDPFRPQSGTLTVPLEELGIDPREPYLCHDLLSDDKYIWYGERNSVRFDPAVLPAHIFRLRKRLRKETDFDYFM